MHKSASRHFHWKGCIETLEDRRVMSADPLLGGSIEHHYFEEDDAPQIEHQLVSEPDFWLDTDNLISLEDQLEQIEQTLYSAHSTTGLNTVVTNYGFTGIGQTVAVIDSGIAYDHFALGGGFGANYRVVGGWDFSGENDANPYDDGPEGSHGTHVAGIIGGSVGNDKGVAPGVDLVALRVFDDAGAGYFSWVENALKWVIENRNSFENPITAINLSLGVSSWNANTVPSWSTLEDEFAQLETAGVFIAVSAGNSFATYNTPGLSYPAASPYVVPVMSVTDSGVLASYSQRDTRAIAAPGSSIRSTVPDYRGNNNGITDDYAVFSGTSMASPYIAGASVLIRQAMDFVGYTNITQDMIYDHMMATGTSFVDSVTGLTFKRLNLGAAISALMPTDDYGSTVATAHNFGTLSSGQSLSGVISTLTDVDYFTFTAAAAGNVSFAVSNSTYNMDAAWSLSNGTGTLSNNGDTFSFAVTAGQTYTVGLSSTGGLGYYDLDVTAQNTFTFTDWGTISYSQLNGLSASGETWYRVQASQTGYLTVESMFGAQNGQINLQLYNSNLQLVTSGNASNGTSRVDTYATTGQQFYVCVLGTNASVNYRLSNLVSLSGTTVNVAGTTGADTFTITAGNTHTLTVNGVTHGFNSVSVNAFNFSGGSGSDSMTFTGTNGSESATLTVGQLNVTGTGYSVVGTSVETITAKGGGGNDQASMYDSAGVDYFVSWLGNGNLYGTGFNNTVSSFNQITGYSTGGADRAYMYDAAGNDTYSTYHNRAVMAGTNFTNQAQNFDFTYGYASSGADVANMYDSTGNDSYHAYSDKVEMIGSGFFNRATAFETTNAYASSGTDRAFMHDSAGDDFYLGWSGNGILYGSTYYNRANGFDQVDAYASTGVDRAYIWDTAGNDTYNAYSNYVSCSGTGYLNQANSFDYSYAYASTGTDVANLYDSVGNDTYYAYSDRAEMIGTGFFNRASGFDKTTGTATTGTDRAYMYDSAGDDYYLGYAQSAVLYGTNYYNSVGGFDQVDGYASTGTDRAYMYDTAGDDTYNTYHNRVSMTGSGYVNQANSFDFSYGYASAGNDSANMYDSAGSDIYTTFSDRVQMSGNGYYNRATGFESNNGFSSSPNDLAVLYDSIGSDQLTVRSWGVRLALSTGRNCEARGFSGVSAYLTSGGVDSTDIVAVDYAFSLYGQG